MQGLKKRRVFKYSTFDQTRTLAYWIVAMFEWVFHLQFLLMFESIKHDIKRIGIQEWTAKTSFKQSIGWVPNKGCALTLGPCLQDETEEDKREELYWFVSVDGVWDQVFKGLKRSLKSKLFWNSFYSITHLKSVLPLELLWGA